MVVASDTALLREVIDDCRNGLLTGYLTRRPLRRGWQMCCPRYCVVSLRFEISMFAGFDTIYGKKLTFLI
jgi:hypothetical protein